MFALLVALAIQEWTPVPHAVVEKRERETVVTFPPIRTGSIKLDLELGSDGIEAWGLAGRIEIAASGKGVVTFKGVGDLCELHVAIRVDKLEVSVPKTRPKPPDVKTVSLGEFKITYYWIVFEEDFKEAADTAVLDPEGKELAKVPAKFAKQLRVEGTGRLKDGRVINVSAGAKDRYEVTTAPFGLGAKGYHLVPFRSIAVDPSVIPMGSRIHIKGFEGIKLPDGSVHDGWFVAHDIGGAIKGKHIDVFALRESHWKQFFLGKLKESLELFKVAE